jgi:hypothetical protein
LLALALMGVVHPFHLVPCLLVPLALAAFTSRHRGVALAAVLTLGASEAMLLGDDQADFNDYKAIYAPLHVPDSKTVAELRSPRGLYMLLDDFTERVDTDVSNNAALLASVPRQPAWDVPRWQSAGVVAAAGRLTPLCRDAGRPALSAAPGAAGAAGCASGGFRLAELAALGAKSIDALESSPYCAALSDGLGWRRPRRRRRGSGG